MKKIIVITIYLLLPILSLAQQTYDVTLQNKSLKESIEIIAQACQMRVTMTNISDQSTYDRTYEDMSCDDMLSDVLSQTTYTYTTQGDRVIIHQKKATPKKPKTSSKVSNSTMSGYIYDQETGETLIGANIYSVTDGLGTSTNAYGFYSLTLPSGAKTIQVSYVGYQPISTTIDLSSDIVSDYELTGANDLEEIVITAENTGRIEEEAKMSTIQLPVTALNTLPAVGGEVDIIKSLQLMPGVQSGSEGFAGLYVRGGSSDQNLITLDGVPIYNASHLFGIFSVFNADAIKSAELTKGGYPARYGGRLSSILDIRMKDGNMNEWKGQGSLGLISSKLTIEGPLIKDKMSLMLSGRRTYIDLIAKPFIKRQRSQNGEKGSAKFHFYDLNAKLNYKISDRDRIYLSFYNGSDIFGDKVVRESEFEGTMIKTDESAFLGWSNNIAALRWNHLFSNKLFANVTLNRTLYNFDVGADNKLEWSDRSGAGNKSAQFYKYVSKVNDLALKVDVDYLPSPRHTIRGGIEVVDHRFTPGVVNVKEEVINISQDTNIGGLPLDAMKYMTYLENEIELIDGLKVNLGVNASIFSINKQTYRNIEPRLLVNLKVSDRWAAKASYTRMNQYLHLLSSTGIGLPTDLWLPPTDRVPEQKSYQYSAGLAHTTDSGIEISLEGYYKAMDNLIAYKEGASIIILSEGWEDQVTTGTGRSYGGELFIKKSFGRTQGWIGYTLSKSDRQFQELNFNRRFPYKFDRTHDFSIVANHKLSQRWTVGSNWVYSTGQAITLPLQEYDSGQTPYSIDPIYHYGERNGSRFKPYHRLDLSLSYHAKARWGDHSFHLDIYNVYSRRNTFYLKVDKTFIYDPVTDTQSYRDELKEVTLLPIIPSIRWDFKF